MLKISKEKVKYLPQFFPKSWADSSEVYEIAFTEEFSIGFVTRELEGYTFLLRDEFEQLRVSSSELLNIATQNLQCSLRSVNVKIYKLNGGHVAFWNSDEDNFTAVRILIPDVQKLLKEKVAENFNFSIPSRDIVTVWNTSEQEENLKFEREAKEDFEVEDYNLSSRTYTWKEILN